MTNLSVPDYITNHNRKYLLHFLPISLKKFSTSKKIEYKEILLKSDYIIDIIHNLILKYYFKSENLFVLNSLVLKDKYGHLYNFYIQYLVDNGIIVMRKNYLKGKSSRIYSLNSSLLKEDIIRYKNTDRCLLKKNSNRYFQNETDKNNLIPIDIKSKLIKDLKSATIEYDKTIFYLDTLKKDLSIYNRNKYSIDSINDSNIFYHFDNYGRMHSNFTILKTFIRKNCLLINYNETCEIDIPNSQPLFLAKLMQDSKSAWINKDELYVFSILVKNGNYYQYLIDNLDIKDKKSAKEITYKVLFGKNHKNSKSDKYFIKLFPTIHNFIVLYKKEHNNYKSLAYTLQMAESDFIFKEVVKTISLINEDIKIVTIHDSLIIEKKWKDFVNNIFQLKMSENFDF